MSEAAKLLFILNQNRSRLHVSIGAVNMPIRYIPQTKRASFHQNRVPIIGKPIFSSWETSNQYVPIDH
jgi:hypothetical protein